ncbi:unnamed protein product [Rotaria magnacalcarata]|uniref:Uncharacterized protein n=1 Tax=Rotaria magnacalcarata TaxID=392030 RepID=A0A820D6Y0_9BILA|nr:unnamed protein product [Rotaria magnacalcarata]
MNSIGGFCHRAYPTDSTKHFRCGNSSVCLHEKQLCNGIYDCPVNHFEDKKNSCVLGKVVFWVTHSSNAYFTCHNDSRISFNQVCNGILNCADGEDGEDEMFFSMKFESLSLRGNKSSLCTLVEIFLTAPRDQVLTELNLAEKCIGDEEVQFIVDALRNNTTIININLAKKNIGVDGTKYMSDLLQNDKTLLTLNLQSTKIGDESTKYLANGLRKNTTLQTLDLRENNIGPLGAQYLADALRENTALVKLILRDNTISDAGLEHLAIALHRIHSQ